MNQGHAGIGDLTVDGWFNVGAYLSAAAACLQMARMSRFERRAGWRGYLAEAAAGRPCAIVGG